MPSGLLPQESNCQRVRLASSASSPGGTLAPAKAKGRFSTTLGSGSLMLATRHKCSASDFREPRIAGCKWAVGTSF